MRIPGSAVALAALLAACTDPAPRPPPPDEPAAGPTSPAPAIRIPVVATLSGPDGEVDESFLDGMTLARERVNRSGGIAGRQLELPLTDDAVGQPAVTSQRIRDVLAPRPPAILVVGKPEAVVAARAEIEGAGVPAIVLGGDLYTGRQHHRYVFQTSVPARWQARVIASYLLEDRGHERVTLLTDDGPHGRVIADAFAAAFVEEGGTPPEHLAIGRPREAAEAASPDAVIVQLPPEDLGALRWIERLPTAPRVVLPPAAPVAAPGWDRPGTVACIPYTWAGWADMLPRVHGFREAFAARFGHVPRGMEQEGYDAVMALGEALGRTGGAGGDELVRALEGFRDETYSSLPVRLGPDDHVLAEESHLGMFAVTDPAGASPGEAFGDVPWRPVMRTFTTDGEKVNLLDRDKRLFFPFWRPKRPTPKYPRSEYGIVTRPSDPLH